MPNEISLSYQFGKSMDCCVLSFFIFIQILVEHHVASSKNPVQTPCSATSDMGFHCLPMSDKQDARLIWVKNYVSLDLEPILKMTPKIKTNVVDLSA